MPKTRYFPGSKHHCGLEKFSIPCASNRCLRSLWMGLLLLAALAGQTIAAAADSPVFPEEFVLAGHDLVSYFDVDAQEQGPKLGKQAHALIYDGRYYAFSSAENARAFSAAPQRYLPAYGGFCAYGLAYRRLLDSDPAIFDIYEGRLFLQTDSERRDKWRKRKPYFVRKASRHWPRMRQR